MDLSDVFMFDPFWNPAKLELLRIFSLRSCDGPERRHIRIQCEHKLTTSMICSRLKLKWTVRLRESLWTGRSRGL